MPLDVKNCIFDFMLPSTESEKIYLNCSKIDEVSIHMRTFPIEFIKDWADVEIAEQIGKGNFGKVFKGFLNLDVVAR